MSDQKENNADDPVAGADVWSRGGEGPHAFVEPQHHVEESDTAGGGESASKSVDMNGAAALAPVLTADDKVVQSVFAVAPEPPVKVEAEKTGKPENVQSAEAETSKPPADSPQEGPKPINQNDVVIGYAILLGLVGLGYVANVMFGGICFVSDTFNAIAALIFFCIPALCAACLMYGDKQLRIKGSFAAVPALLIVLWGAWYYHIFDQIKNNVGPYGDKVSTSHENGWDICRYDCNWDYGNQTASTMTRERPAGPGLRFVHRMSFGELP